MICKLLGHKWDKTDLHTQPCKRFGCKIKRILMATKYISEGDIHYIYIKTKK